jgi:hypothetical protein
MKTFRTILTGLALSALGWAQPDEDAVKSAIEKLYARVDAAMARQNAEDKVDEDAIYVRRSGGSFDGSLRDLRIIAASFDDDDFNAVAEASTRRGTVQFARRTASGDVALAGFGGANSGGGPPISTAFFDELIPPHGKYIKGILVNDREDTPLRVTEGLIELPANPSEESRRQAHRLSEQVESKPKIGERIEKLASIGSVRPRLLQKTTRDPLR